MLERPLSPSFESFLVAVFLFKKNLKSSLHKDLNKDLSVIFICDLKKRCHLRLKIPGGQVSKATENALPKNSPFAEPFKLSDLS